MTFEHIDDRQNDNKSHVNRALDDFFSVNAI